MTSTREKRWQKHFGRLKCKAYLPDLKTKQLADVSKCPVCQKDYSAQVDSDGIFYWKPIKGEQK